MMLQQIDKKNKLLLYLFFLFFLSTTNNIYLKNLDLINIDILNIKVTGLNSNENEKISNELFEYVPKNIFFVGKEYFIDILENHNLIKSFSIKKKYPNTIHINIKEAEFLGLNIQDKKTNIIGSNGKFIDIKYKKKDLPYVFGNINIKQFLELINIINKSKFNINEIKEFYYFQSDRWDIKIIDEKLIKLPKDNLLITLNNAFEIINDENFLNIKILDLRIPNQIITTNE